MSSDAHKRNITAKAMTQTLHSLLYSVFFLCVAVTTPVMASDAVATTEEAAPSQQEGDVVPPTLGEEPPAGRDFNFMSEMMNMLLSLGLVVLMILVAGWLLKRLMRTRLQQGNRSSSIKIVDRRSLAPKANVYLLEVCGKGLVIGESPAGLQNLGTVSLELLDEEQTEVEEGEIRRKFASFGKVIGKKFTRPAVDE